MKIFHVYALQPVAEKSEPIQRFLAACESNGVRVVRDFRDTYLFRAWFPTNGDPNAFASFMAAVAPEGFEESCKFTSTSVECKYSQEDINLAMLFNVRHYGRSVDPLSPKHDVISVLDYTSIDLNSACAKCSAGAIQSEPLRISASSAGRVKAVSCVGLGSVGEFLLSDELLRVLEKELGCEIPKRPVLAGKQDRDGGQVWQVDPEMEFPFESYGGVGSTFERCDVCGRLWIRSTCQDWLTTVRYHAVRQGTVRERDLCPAMWAPFWYGERHIDAMSGRLIDVPWRSIWLRGDVGRALVKRKLPRVTLTPFVEVASDTGRPA